MQILLLEPFFSGSHAAWAKAYKAQSKHQLRILSLPGRYWKWRMHGGALTLARESLELDVKPDLIIASDMLDLTTFQALTRERLAEVPAAMYFHENQLTYPWSLKDRDVKRGRDRHYGFINISSALSADANFFNSHYHLESFLTAADTFLKSFPDCRETTVVERIREKSSVLFVGLELERLEAARARGVRLRESRTAGRPLVVWNHRWEYDKNPGLFFDTLVKLAGEGIEFELAVLGEAYSNCPKEFSAAREHLSKQIVHWGYAENESEYAAWLWAADILPVTSKQEFFGISVLEAIHCGCVPLLPRRLSYPELIPEALHQRVLYSDDSEFKWRLKELLTSHVGFEKTELSSIALAYDWERMAPCYDNRFEELISNK